MKEVTLKTDDGSPIPRLEAEGKGTANNSESSDEIKVCNARDCECTARAGYTCRHDGPCKQIVGDNTDQPRCPDCGSIALKFTTRDYCEGDYYRCHACGCGPILFPLNMCLSSKARKAAMVAVLQFIPAAPIIDADAIQRTIFADAEPFDASQFVHDIVGS